MRTLVRSIECDGVGREVGVEAFCQAAKQVAVLDIYGFEFRCSPDMGTPLFVEAYWLPGTVVQASRVRAGLYSGMLGDPLMTVD